MSSLEHIDFGFIRYANCWEDADILLQGLAPRPDSRIISICSGGDNTLSLLTTSPAEVIAVDVSEVQLYLMELKMQAIRYLEREEYLQFAGFEKSNDRLKVYNRLRTGLSTEAAAYWEKHRAIVEKGLIYGGKFDSYLRFFAHYIRPLIHSKKAVKKLLTEKTADEQVDFYENQWDNRRWRALFKLFFSQQVMGRFGRDPELMRHVEGNVADYLYKKTAQHFCSTFAQQNFILHYILLGHYGELLPHYVREENYSVIKQGLDLIKLGKGYVEAVAAKYPGIDAFNLSNIFEYLDFAVFEKLSEQLFRFGNKDATYAYWNLMVPRNMADVQQGIYRDHDFSKNLSNRDCGFFYSGFCVDRKISN